MYKLFGVYHTTNFVHFSLPSLLLTTVSMKAIPRTPSATVGKSCSSAVGVRPSFLAETVSAKLRYILAKDSNNPSGCPAGIRVLCVSIARAVKLTRLIQHFDDQIVRVFVGPFQATVFTINANADRILLTSRYLRCQQHSFRAIFKTQ